MEIQKTYKLFLDDIREIKDVCGYIKNEIYLDEDWVIVRDYNEFVDKISTDGMPFLISFDHDLSKEHYNPLMYEGETYNELYDQFKEKTGFDCAKWLIDFCMDNKIKLPDFMVHSMNPVGGNNIKGLLENYRKHENEL